MMKKILMLVMILTILGSYVVIAADYKSIMPVEVEIGIDFQGERDFRILLPNGVSLKRIFWDVNETPNDINFTQTIYYTLDEEKYCTNYKAYSNTYKDMNNNLTGIMGVCSSVIKTLNDTKIIDKQLRDKTVESKDYENMWKICEEDRKDAINSSKKYEREASNYKEDYETCDRSLENLKETSINYKTCTEDLKDCESSGKNSWLIFGILGLVVGYFIWGRKTGSGPSEQAESGNIGDRVPTPQERMDSAVEQFNQQNRPGPYDDGPKQ